MCNKTLCVQLDTSHVSIQYQWLHVHRLIFPGTGIRNVWLQLHVQFLAKSDYYYYYYYYFIKPDGVKGSYLPASSVPLYLYHC
jgi:hypothetical protein